jgi:hypothetical protein
LSEPGLTRVLVHRGIDTHDFKSANALSAAHRTLTRRRKVFAKKAS